MKSKMRYKNIVFSCLAAVFISVPIALLMVIMNYGFKPGFIMAFIRSALLGTAISVPLANLLLPLAQKIVNKIFEN